jgi:hypothetical protein
MGHGSQDFQDFSLVLSSVLCVPLRFDFLEFFFAFLCAFAVSFPACN